MRKLVYYVGVSIDGYIAGPGGEFDFYPQSDEMGAWIYSEYPETVPTHIRPHIGLDAPNRRFDTVLMLNCLLNNHLKSNLIFLRRYMTYLHQSQDLISNCLN